MCGITGILENSLDSSIADLGKMTDILQHRGPDGRGEFISKEGNYSLGLGHRRLSVIDITEHAGQPMSHKHWKIVFNGEIYNYREIRKELETLGHSFKTNSDTEVILQSYEAWGTGCLHKFIGMFAFIIYDSLKHELFCARDRTGIKPFFYYTGENVLLFASELKSFHQHRKFKKEIDKASLAAFMQFGNVPSPYSIFKNTFKLEPGHYMTVNCNDLSRTSACYWNVYDNAYLKPKLKIGYEDAKQQTVSLLENCFNYRMVSDVPVGVFLSGGYDSACVTALLQKNRTSKLKTFTIGVQDRSLDESAYAAQVAKHLGTDHHEFICTERETFDLVQQLPFHYDEPFGDSSAIPTALVSKMARKQVTVALSADGGDEIFAGYNRYDILMRQGKLMQNTPAFIRNSLAGIMKKIPSESIPHFNQKYNFHNRYHKLTRLLQDPSTENLMFSLSSQFDPNELCALFQDPICLPGTKYDSGKKGRLLDPLCAMMAIDYETYLPDDILQKVDRASMMASLEAREPFLDHRIIEWAACLPNEFKYRNGIKKYMIRDIVHSYIPEKLMTRPKMGFAIPIEKWMRNELKHLIDHYTSEAVISNQGIFNYKEVQLIRDKFHQGRTENALKLWYLLMFEMWYDRWMK